MATPNYRKLIKLHEQRPADARTILQEAFGRDPEGKRLDTREYRPADFDFGRLLEECVGTEEFRACRSQGRSRLISDVLEAAGAVSTASFVNITYQIMYSAFMDAYEGEEFVFTKLIPVKQSRFIGQEKLAGITQIGDAALVVPEGQEFPLAGLGQTWVHLPEALKRGEILALTREVIFSDLTGQLIERASKVGYWLAVNREKRAIDVVIDENGGAVNTPLGHRYRYRDTYIATYGDNSGTHNWDNLAASNDLTGGDWTKIDAANQLFNNLVDPETGEPILTNATYLITTKQLEWTARRVLNATEVNVTTPGFATSGVPSQTAMKNPVAGTLTLVSSRLLAQRLATDTHWFLGDPTKAFVYKEIFAPQVIEAPPNNLEEFKRDIVRQWRADEMGAYATIEPRYMIKGTP